MNYKVALFLLGFLLALVGNIYIFFYLNLLSFGYSFLDYLYYIFTHIECLLFFIGIILLKIALNKGEKI